MGWPSWPARQRTSARTTAREGGAIQIFLGLAEKCRTIALVILIFGSDILVCKNLFLGVNCFEYFCH